MGIGRTPPVAERPISGTSIQEGPEVLSGLVVKGFLGAIHPRLSALAVTQCENWLKLRPAGSKRVRAAPIGAFNVRPGLHTLYW